MSGQRLHRIRRHYEARVTPHREPHDILDWSSRESQERRFQVLVDVLRQTFPVATVPRLLDVGCGMTDLASYLEGHGTPVRYVGADVTLAILTEARRRHPQRLLLAADAFAAPPFAPRSFDVCYCSGVFNLNLGNNDAFASEALPRLLDLANRIAVANFLHRRCPHKYEHCHYFDPEVLSREMSRRGLRVVLVDDYLENDFTLVLAR
jgi:SAM-dependent methyltransferase